MRIVQVCPRYYPYTGGIERVVKNIAEFLVRMSHEITVYATDPSCAAPRFEILGGVKLKIYPALAPNEAYYLPHPSMFVDLSAERMDILHAHNIQALTTLTAYAAHKLFPKSPYVLSPFYHGRGHTNLAQLLWTPYKPLAKKIIRNADKIIVNSEAQRAVIEKTFKPVSEILKVHDGVNIEEIRRVRPFFLAEKQKTLIYVGRLEEYKNIHVTIAAMKYLPEYFHFYIIGRGPFRSILQNLVQSYGLTRRVHFLGFQPDHTVYQWIKTADVFVHLSAVESFGMTCIESLAAGTPVIANNDGFGLSETIAMYPEAIIAYRVGEEPIPKLAELIIQVAQSEPKEVDLSEFSWEAIAENVETIYKQILENR